MGKVEDRYIEKVKLDGLYLKKIRTQTPRICLEAVKQNPKALEFVKDKTDEVCIEAVKKEGDLIRYIKKPSLIISLEALNTYGGALQYIAPEFQDEDLCWSVLKNFSYAIGYIKNQTPEMCLYSVRSRGGNLANIKVKTKELIKEAVKQDGEALAYVSQKDQTVELCLEAIKTCSHAIAYIRLYSDEMVFRIIHVLLETGKSFEEIRKLFNYYAPEFGKYKDIKPFINSIKKFMKDPKIAVDFLANPILLIFIEDEFKLLSFIDEVEEFEKQRNINILTRIKLC